ncbi:DNA helicase MCM8-like [Halichondria panicea]|uniref:DNA helicase MCM8-like n=1 Tax=Halichondria panicea TaxID=6063 RepID=UPI00312B42E2
MSQGGTGPSSGRGRARGSGWRGGFRGSRGSYRGWRRGTGYHGNRETSNGALGTSSYQPRLVQTSLVSCPYPRWNTYLPYEDYSESSPAVFVIKTFVGYFESHLVEYNIDEIEATGSLPLDYSTLLSDATVQRLRSNIAEDIINHPERTLNSVALALHTLLSRSLSGESDKNIDSEEASFDRPRFYIRLFNFEPVLPLKHLKASQYGKCVTVQGTVVRVSNIQPLVTTMAFRCSLCQSTITVHLPDGKYKQPAKCLDKECRGKMFTPLRSSPLTQTIDWQTIRVQELASDDRREAGRIPRTVECELTADLVDSCVPGDMVTITAIVKATGSEEAGRTKSTKDKCMFLLYLNAVSVTNNKTGGDASHGLHMEFSTKDYYAIQEIHSEKSIFKLIVGSLCPTIYGHELVKAGLVLGLFGGAQKYTDLLNNLPIRGDPHILVVGDPGLGKSQMLQAAANVAPRGVYVCGNTTTSSGLTVTLNRDGGSGNYTLEAGALVLADQGCCCIDEFDKMGSQHQALLEAMEQQSISIAKAGIVCSLPARTSIFAAANPVGGHYNKAKTVSENLKMNGALLSRFDLVFILLDRPDQDHDTRLSEHVMAMHSRGQGSPILQTTARKTSGGGIESSINESSLLLMGEDDTLLLERLKLKSTEDFDPVPPQLLRKYIGYARKYVHPILSEEAADVLQKFYLELRQARQTSDSTPITTRQLESLIRLTEARARLELRETASGQDAKDVVEVMKYSMFDTFSDQFGMVDFQRSQHGSGMSHRAKAKKYINELTHEAEINASSLFTTQQLRDVAKRIGVGSQEFDDLICSLNNQNYLLKKGPGRYQLQTASCL